MSKENGPKKLSPYVNISVVYSPLTDYIVLWDAVTKL